MNNVLRIIAVVVASFLLLTAGYTAAADIQPYQTYSYVNGQVKASPATLTPVSVVTGEDIGVGPFRTPQDIFVADNKIYIADTDNNRIVITDMEYRLLRTIEKVFCLAKTMQTG